MKSENLRKAVGVVDRLALLRKRIGAAEGRETRLRVTVSMNGFEADSYDGGSLHEAVRSIYLNRLRMQERKLVEELRRLGVSDG